MSNFFFSSLKLINLLTILKKLKITIKNDAFKLLPKINISYYNLVQLLASDGRGKL